MNILLTGDDGPSSFGLEILKAGVQRAHKNSNFVTITTDRPMSGQGMSVRTVQMPEIMESLKEVKQDVFTAVCKPVDVIYLAFYHPERFLRKGTFDLVCVGVNHGHNVGLDVFHSGTVGMAMFAATIFGASSVAFSQQMENINPTTAEEDQNLFGHTDRFVHQFLNMNKAEPGTCWNVNFPIGEMKGWKMVDVAPVSRFRKHPDEGMQARIMGTDITELNQGFATVSELDLRVIPALRY